MFITSVDLAVAGFRSSYVVRFSVQSPVRRLISGSSAGCRSPLTARRCVLVTGRRLHRSPFSLDAFCISLDLIVSDGFLWMGFLCLQRFPIYRSGCIFVNQQQGQTRVSKRSEKGIDFPPFSVVKGWKRR